MSWVNYKVGEWTSSRGSRNALPMRRRSIGRQFQWRNPKTGSSNPSAKLNEDDVREIRRLHKECSHSIKELADLFNVAKCTLEKVIYYQTWKHIV